MWSIGLLLTQSSYRTCPRKGHVDFYQAFGGAANVSGGDEHRDVTVNGKPALLYRNPPDGELVLVWLLEETGWRSSPTKRTSPPTR